MKNKKLIFFSIITMLSFIIGFSYAYYTPKIIGNDTANGYTSQIGTLILTYNGTSYISMPNAKPGDYSTKTFTVKNTGTLSVSGYDVNISNLINQFINNEMVYSLTCSSSDANPCANKSESPVPYTESLIHTGSSIAPNTTHTYTLTLRFIETSNNQNYNQGKQLSFKLTINLLEKLPNYIVEVGYWSAEQYFWAYNGDITSITFEDEINLPVNVEESWDVSENKDGSIMAYIIDDGQGNGKYELYIQSIKGIYGNPNSELPMFYNFSNLNQINNIELFNTSELIDMTNMFYDCNSLTNLDLSSWNTSNVTNMTDMFSNCSDLVTLDLSGWDTSNVITIQSMFYYCESLVSVDLSGLDTKNINDMRYVFSYCESLISLDLSDFDTSNVEYMTKMFYDCNSLTSLNISNHTFSQSINNYQKMFYNVNRAVIITKNQTAQNYIENPSNWQILSEKELSGS